MVERKYSFDQFNTDQATKSAKTSYQKEENIVTPVLKNILDKVQVLDFRERLELEETEKIKQKHAIVLVVDEVCRIADQNQLALAVQNDFIYIYNGHYWAVADKNEFKVFLAEAALKMGYKAIDCRHYKFRNELFQQFLAVSYFPAPNSKKDITLINLKNGTLEISPNGFNLRPPDSKDFLTYQLDFEYDQNADCPIWLNFLEEMQPDLEAQKVLAEYMGYIFTRHLKLEKVLVLYGSGGNGKSVFFDVMCALLGKENISHYSLSELNEEHYRAAIHNKILNYGSEIDGNKIMPDIWKKLSSGESISMRQKYGNPYNSDKYAKLLFNCNTLPNVKEYTEAYFRRYLIIPFDQKPKSKDISLAKKIIKNEMAGVLNWILIGLDRLLKNNDFTKCKRAEAMLHRYKIESDNVALFLEDNHIQKDEDFHISLKSLIYDYRNYCLENGYKPLGRSRFKSRLEYHRFLCERKSQGFVVFAKQIKK